MVIKMAKVRLAHACTHGARKPPGPICMRKYNNIHTDAPYMDIGLDRPGATFVTFLFLQIEIVVCTEFKRNNTQLAQI